MPYWFSERTISVPVTESGWSPRYAQSEETGRAEIMRLGQIVRVNKGRWKGYVGSLVNFHFEPGKDSVTVQVATDKKLKSDVAEARRLTDPVYRNETNYRWIQVSPANCSFVADEPRDRKYR
jgi:hypothetical protein